MCWSLCQKTKKIIKMHPHSPHTSPPIRCLDEDKLFPASKPVLCEEKRANPFFEIKCCRTGDLCNKFIRFDAKRGEMRQYYNKSPPTTSGGRIRSCAFWPYFHRRQNHGSLDKNIAHLTLNIHSRTTNNYVFCPFWICMLAFVSCRINSGV